MKKLVACLCLFSLVLVGCNDKKVQELKCTMEETVSENNVIKTIETNFENNKVLAASIKLQTLLNEKYLPYIDSFVKQMEEQFSNYKDKKGITSNIYQDDTSVTVYISFNINNLDDDTKQELGFINTDDSYDSAKKSLESNGYKCK